VVSGAIGGTRGASDLRLCEAGCCEWRRDAERGRIWDCWAVPLLEEIRR